jgi:hypothetical protein
MLFRNVGYFFSELHDVTSQEIKFLSSEDSEVEEPQDVLHPYD